VLLSIYGVLRNEHGSEGLCVCGTKSPLGECRVLDQHPPHIEWPHTAPLQLRISLPKCGPLLTTTSPGINQQIVSGKFSRRRKLLNLCSACFSVRGGSGFKLDTHRLCPSCDSWRNIVIALTSPKKGERKAHDCAIRQPHLPSSGCSVA